jgi:hypothetical protein
MPIAYENAAAAASVFNGDISFDPVGDLVLGFAANGANDPTSISATYGTGGSPPAMTYVDGENDDFLAVAMLQALGQVPGAKTLTPSGGTIRGIAALSISGAHLTTPVRPGSFMAAINNTGVDDALTLNLVSAVGDLAVFALIAQDANNVGGTGGISWSGATARAQCGGTAVETLGLAIATAPGAALVSVTAGFQPGFNRAALIGFSIQPDAGGGGGGGGGAGASVGGFNGILQLTRQRIVRR